MGWLQRVVSGLRGTPTPRLETQPRYRVEVVGESHYHETFLQMLGGYSRDGYNVETSAVLKAEPFNQYDPDAVAVFIWGRKIGYLPRENAARFRQALPEVMQAQCGAVIRGGWRTNQHDSGDFGVRLNFSWPPRIVPNNQ